MIGFPKSDVDFSKQSYKNWQNSFDKQILSYLNPSCLLSERKNDWRHFPFGKVFDRNFAFDFKGLDFKDKKSLFKNSIVIQVKNGKASVPEHPGISLFCWSDFLKGKLKLADFVKKEILNKLDQKRNHFCSLNNTFFPKGFILILKKNLSQPVEIHYSQDSDSLEQGLNLRNFIFVESKAQVIEVFHSRESNKDLFLNLQTDCFVKEQASLEFSCLDQTSNKDILIHQMFSHLSKKSQAHFFTLCLNSAVSRWHRQVEHKEQSQSHIRALSLISGKTHTDHQVCVKHKGEQGLSDQLYKSFLFDSARHIFHSLISIEESAKESDTSQLNKNYLFSPKASAISSPMLDVCPSQVKAGHGATVSSFDEKEDLIFYLKSRGIDSSLSFDLILSSLLKETFSNLEKNTQEIVQNLVQNKLLTLQDSLRKT